MRASTFGLLAVTALVVFVAASAAPDGPPKEALTAFNKAEEAVKAKRTDEAIRDYERAVALFPGYAEAWYGLGRLRVEHEPDAARKALESAIQADPKFVDPYLALAALERAARNWKEVVRVTDLLLLLNSVDYPQAWLLNAVGNYGNGNMEAAERSAREAEQLDIQRKFPETLQVLGVVLARRNDFAGAAASFREYLRVVPSGANADSVRTMMAEAEKRAATAAPSESVSTFTAEANLAVVRFQVHPKKGELIRNLVPDDIEIRADGAPQKIAVFEGLPAHPRSVPIEISLLFDVSGSVERIGAINPHVLRENLLDEFPNTTLAIYGFSDYLARFTRPSRDPNTLNRATDRVSTIPPRNTPLFGSIADTVRDANLTRGSVLRMVVIFSDGKSHWPGDEDRADEAARVAQESGTTLYPVMLTGPAGPVGFSAQQRLAGPAVPPGCVPGQEARPSQKTSSGNGNSETKPNKPTNNHGTTTSKHVSSGTTPPTQKDPPRNTRCPPGYVFNPVAAREAQLRTPSREQESMADFMKLADETGGKAFQHIVGADVLPAILKNVAEEIRNDYVAGFYLSPSADRKKHKIEVVLRSKDRGELVGGSRTVEF